MSTIPKISEVQCDDWVKLYYNGVPFHEGHSARADVILAKLVREGLITHEEVYLDYVDPYNTEKSFPDTLPEDLKSLPGYLA